MKITYREMGFGILLIVLCVLWFAYNGTVTVVGNSSYQGADLHGAITTGGDLYLAYASVTDSAAGSTVSVNYTDVTGHVTATSYLGGSGVSGTGQLDYPSGYLYAVNPGTDTTPGRLRIGSGTLYSYNVQLNGVTAGTDYDQLVVTGAVDLPANATLTVSVGFLPTIGDRFTIIDNDDTDSVTGQFSGLPEGNLLIVGTHVFQVTYQGGDGNDVVLVALSGNKRPYFTSVAAANVAENTPANTTILSVVAIDDDLPPQTVTYLIAGGADQASFDITSDGVLTFRTVPDYEHPADHDHNNEYLLEVSASDGVGGSAIQSILVTVTPLNDISPVITSAATANVAENTPASVVVLDVNATDADLPVQSIVYSLAGDDVGDFTINSATGEIRFAVAADFELPVDADGDNMYQVMVIATDSGSPALSSSQSVTITVTAENDNTPSIVTAATVSIGENTPTSAVVLDVNATDADLPTQGIVYSLSGIDSDDFTIDSATGEIRFAVSPNFELPADADGNNVYLLSVTATDAGSPVLSSTQNLTITVTDALEIDFGDAPDSYGTTLAANGAQHLTGALFLGASVDTEADGQPSANADGDGADENGVVLPATLYARVGANISVNASAAGRLDAWIDFNRNGVFDTEERIANGLNMAAGANSFTITLPTTMVAGPTFARFRISSTGGLEPAGYANTGEVEDYPLTLAVPAPGSIQVVDDPENPGQGLLLIQGTNYFYETISVQPTWGQSGKVTASISPGTTVAGIDLASFQRITIFGEGGMDSITIGNAITKPSVIYGDAGFDTVNGGGGADTIYGGADYDSLYGNGGDDTFVNEGGADYINGGAGFDTIVKRGSGTFALSNYLLSVGYDYVSISSIENATLIGGSGPDIFNLTGWTGGVSVQGGGGSNTLIDSADGNFVVQANSLTRTVGSMVSTINFTEIDIVNLTGGFGNNSFDLSAWTKQAVLSGGYWGTDTVTVAGNVDYQLSDVLLMRPGMGMIRLSGFENAIITGGTSANTFNLSNWNQAATLKGEGGNDKLIAAGNVNFTLSDTSLTRSTGGAITLSSIEQAELIGGAGNNIINAAAFSGSVKIDGSAGNDTITGGSGITLLLGGAGNDVINAGSGRSLMIGGLGLDRLTGGSNDDLLIDGQTVHDTNAAALDALLAEWASSNSYLDRVAHLTGTSGGANGSTHLGGDNVLHDTAVDVLFGGDGDDLFFAKLDSPALDVLSDKQGNETAH